MQDVVQKPYFEAGKGLHYGTILPVIAVWHQLGLEQVINESLPVAVHIPVSRIALIQTANRFSVPSSKLACYRWYGLSVFSQLSKKRNSYTCIIGPSIMYVRQKKL